MYEIVIFFVGGARPHESGQAAFDAEIAQIDLLCRSALARESRVALTILTDHSVDFSGLSVPAKIVRFNFAQSPLMLSRLTAESQYITEHPLDWPIILLDTDVLVNRSLAWLFEEDFDIGVTLRRKKNMPINSGVRLINNKRPWASRRFMRDVAALVRGPFLADADWWADQKALNAMVPVGSARRLPAIVEHSGYRIRLLSTSKYNFSPPAIYLASFFPYKGRYILHFKGPARKPLMRAFFARHFQR